VLVMLNHRLWYPVRTRCRQGNTWALMQEPHAPGVNEWMVRGHDAFDRVFTHHIPGPHPRYHRSHPGIPWHVNRTFDELVELGVPDKPRPLSWVLGNARLLPGHALRFAFLDVLRQAADLDIDLLGRAARPIPDKYDGLAPYRYSLAVENSSGPDYWTEKIADCFLAWTVPIYYGCTNLEEYFPADSFIRMDIRKPGEAIAIIRHALAADDWARRLPALKIARERVLQRYQLFPHLAALIEKYADTNTPVRAVKIPAGEKCPLTVWQRLRRRWRSSRR
jgi:hypothetical protein